MDSDRWQRVQALFHDVADLPTAERDRYLMAASGGDTGLVAEVLRLIEGDSAGAPILELGVARVAGDVFAPADPTARNIGPYRLERLLGEGGMGVVYLARREDLASTVAIKILKDAWLSPSRRERFAAEQRTLAQLVHPGIARIYDADTLPDGTPWFAMEYVQGEPLDRYVDALRPALAELLGIFRSVCEAVAYAHSRAVIHRDLKPSNILVTPEGGIRLLDFGIATRLDETRASHHTVAGMRLLTPAFAAPEILAGEPAGVQTDVYALGVILYRLLTGRLPYEANAPHRDAPRPSIAAHKDERIPKAAWPDLDVLCLTAIHPDPARRYRSVEALTRDVDHFLRLEPLEARPDSRRYRFGKFLARNRRSVWTTASAAMVLVALSAVFTVRLARARRAELAEAARTARIERFMLNLFEGGDPEAGPADDLRVTAILDRGSEEANALRNEPEIQAELYYTLGGIYRKLGKLDRADALLGAALDRRRALHGPDHPEVAETMLAIGLLRNDQARFDEAERASRDALTLLQRTGRRDAALARAMTTLGSVLAARGHYPESIAQLNSAVAALSGVQGAESDLAAAVVELAHAHFLNGSYTEAEPLYRRALELHQRVHGDRHPLIADDLMSLANVAFQRGRYADAEQLDRQALQMARAFYGDNHFLTTTAMTSLSQALVFQKKYDEAEGLLNQALAARERIYGPNHPRVASTLNEIGNLAYLRDRLDEAGAAFTRVLAIYRAVYGARHYLVGIALSNLASVSMDRKDWPLAEKMFREVVALYAATLPAEHVNRAIGEIKLGRTLVRQHRFAEAEPHTAAGLATMLKQTSPSVSWVRGARRDMVEIYTATGREADAAAMRVQLEGADKK